MTPDRPLPLAEALAALVSKLAPRELWATDAPWQRGTSAESAATVMTGSGLIAECMKVHDAAFIVDARNALPRILSVLRRAAVLEEAAREWDEAKRRQDEHKATGNPPFHLSAWGDWSTEGLRRDEAVIVAEDALRAALAGGTL